MTTKRKAIAVAGGGPMALFVLKHLMAATIPLRVVLFERHDLAGTGMPYRQDISPDFMLANIFSREIPTIQQPLATWLRAQPADMLARWGLRPKDISARAFYPRTLLGAYLAAQLQELVAAGTAAGHQVELRTEQDVIDIHPRTGAVVVAGQPANGPKAEAFDHIILATGHTWDAVPTEGEATLISPWPASNICALAAASIGILGSSLSAVDVAVALAYAHGRFSGGAKGLKWTPKPGHAGLRITMVSKTGILPEADFYYAYPYEPLIHLTEEAVQGLVNDGKGRLLRRTFDLLLAELRSCDPDYLRDLALDRPTISSFAKAYFARRQRLGAFRALKLNLVESRATIRRKETIAWRYALLRGHEVFEAALPHLTAAEWKVFRSHLLPVFADCYAAVPHLSLDRLVALHDAGVLDVVRSGDKARFLAGPQGGVFVRNGNKDLAFEAMVDARGQTSAPPADLPFPTLVNDLTDPDRPVEAPFPLALRGQSGTDVICLSMPQVLERYPFSQGLPNCDALAERAVAALLNPRPAQSRKAGRLPAA
jgi:uncharacterized NAD(P)/FAD-binding protein YdhS